MIASLGAATGWRVHWTGIISTYARPRMQTNNLGHRKAEEANENRECKEQKESGELRPKCFIGKWEEQCAV
jgi:hypothetical protein